MSKPRTVRPRRPPFIISSADLPERSHKYPNSDEPMAPSRRIGHAAGLGQIGLHLVRVLPGQRTSWPHCEEKEEEFAYVIDGDVDCWIDGELHPMTTGDLVAWPPGTGISHTIINNGSREALLLAGGQTTIAGSRIYYPMHPNRRNDLTWAEWWENVPKRRLGGHDGVPDARRGAAGRAKKAT